MVFGENIEKLVQDLIQAEYKNACDKFGEKYHSLHEGYAVLLEEMEEAQNEVDKTKCNLDILWEKIKNQDDIYSFIRFIDCTTFNAIQELAQVGAALMKIKNTLEKSDDTNVSIKRKVCNTECEHIFKAYGEHFCYAQKNMPQVKLGDKCPYKGEVKENEN